jgi:hypothetical protein
LISYADDKCITARDVVINGVTGAISGGIGGPSKSVENLVVRDVLNPVSIGRATLGSTESNWSW